MEAPLGPDDVGRQLGLDSECLDRLIAYAELLVKWQARINLVGPGTIPDLWRRHILDSAQLFPYLPDGPVLDLGSGAGFPGLVLAILRGGKDAVPVHLAESDGRKGAFLREAIRVTGASAVVHTARIESLTAFPVGAITARALAPLGDLLKMAEKFLQPSVHCLFLKGRSGDEELTQAAKDWMMTIERISSLTDPSGVILHLSEVHRGRDER
ncbi:16S rRNA (guanine(527)-N(7))-methyltransferase RsmG [Telmatospirillum sp.]|uniref:16S rRNA (guanine(527)-N(7))-methyltransferase RsmG n=1 Tax=Telmatospirillum sp. TaxID=2079197 RepID=UPI0028490FA2|nr:16S rRNA (guanine(527)-N(7))-methyltransferase RsmG [Telmatospirillum sp.]MDR3439596.1 16S rRNA (guanine(527)-N(7))-methyltransferase RsmG [Telmatospirillum sp.]